MRRGARPSPRLDACVECGRAYPFPRPALGDGGLTCEACARQAPRWPSRPRPSAPSNVFGRVLGRGVRPTAGQGRSGALRAPGGAGRSPHRPSDAFDQVSAGARRLSPISEGRAVAGEANLYHEHGRPGLSVEAPRFRLPVERDLRRTGSCWDYGRWAWSSRTHQARLVARLRPEPCGRSPSTSRSAVDLARLEDETAALRRETRTSMFMGIG